jgi:hypothetical protein
MSCNQLEYSIFSMKAHITGKICNPSALSRHYTYIILDELYITNHLLYKKSHLKFIASVLYYLSLSELNNVCNDLSEVRVV